MDKQRKTENWLRYSSIWRNVLTHILEWSAERVDEYIEELRQEMETGAHDPAGYGFFFDLPSWYLTSALLGNGLHERIMRCKSNESNPQLIYQRLVRAITGNHLEREMDNKDFDWDKARQRYQSERRRIEEWLEILEKA